jgi:hypothetical protein
MELSRVPHPASHLRAYRPPAWRGAAAHRQIRWQASAGVGRGGGASPADSNDMVVFAIDIVSALPPFAA